MLTINLIIATAFAGLTLAGLFALQSPRRLVNWAGRLLLGLVVGLIVYAIANDSINNH